MTGLIVVGYDVLPEALLVALQLLTGKQEQICAVSLSPGEDAQAQRQLILDAAEKVNTGEGVIVFVDSASAPAGHLMLSLMDKIGAEVVTGVNLPMLEQVVHARNSMPPDELARLARDEGRKNITWRTP